MMNRNRKIALLVIAYGVCVWQAGFAAAPALLDGIIAIVGPRIVTFSDLQKLKDQARTSGMLQALYGTDLGGGDITDDRLVSFLIEGELVKLGTESSGIGASVEDKDIEIFITQTGVPRDKLMGMLKQEGMTYVEYQERIADRMRRERFLHSMVYRTIDVTPEQVEDELQRAYPPTSFYQLSLVVVTPDESGRWQTIAPAERTSQFERFSFSRKPVAVGGHISELAPPLISAIRGKPVGFVSGVIDMNGKSVVVKIDSIGSAHVIDSPEYQKKRSEVQEQLIRTARRKQLEEWVRKQLFNLKVERFALPSSAS